MSGRDRGALTAPSYRKPAPNFSGRQRCEWYHADRLAITGRSPSGIGRTVPHYQILDRIGRGGMGVVYRARDVTLDREAFRFIAQEKRRDSEARRRFLREAQAASQLDDQALSAGARDIVTECEVILRLLGIEPRSPGEG